MKLTIINDCHLGVKRQSGTTPDSMAQFQDWHRAEFERLLAEADNSDLLINGDLFDKSEVSRLVEFQTYTLLIDWLSRNNSRHLYLSMGNHDETRDSSKPCSFRNLCNYLKTTPLSERIITVTDGFKAVDRHSLYIVPHMTSQQLFDAELEKVLSGKSMKYCAVHCNLMSPFAMHSDHSLNIDEVMLKRFADKGIHLIFGHEHNARVTDSATVVGAQLVTSISDCLDSNSCKQYAVIEDGNLTTVDWQPLSEIYEECDWQSDALPDKRFIRISGKADYTQSADVIRRISEFRRMSSAFVISNAVRLNEAATTVANVQDVKQFDIQKLFTDGLPENLKSRFLEVLNRA